MEAKKRDVVQNVAIQHLTFSLFGLPWHILFSPFQSMQHCNLRITSLGAQLKREFGRQILYMHTLNKQDLSAQTQVKIECAHNMYSNLWPLHNLQISSKQSGTFTLRRNLPVLILILPRPPSRNF
jgi:hypothetical protein